MPCVLYMVWWSKIWTMQSKYNPTCHFDQMLLQIGCHFSITWSCCIKTNSKSPGHVVINNNFILFWFNWSYIYDNIWYIYIYECNHQCNSNWFTNFGWAGITCVCSWGRTYCQVVCPARSSLMLCWARTPFRLSWEIMTQRNTGQTTSVSSASPPIKPMSWKRGWWSCTAPTGEISWPA